jgi:hypothetical protein
MPRLVTELSNKRWIPSSGRRIRIPVRPLRIQVADRWKRGGAAVVPTPSHSRIAAPLLALAIGYLAATGCDYTEYPIEATFCDDWCRVLRRTGCEQEPENCIRDCESSRASDRCFALQSSLLDCYESTPADRFECVGQGFQSRVRPRPEICTEQRHALIRCEVPRVMECVDACIAVDVSGASGGAADAGAAAATGVCPEPPFPCERLCWELDARFGRGRPTTLTSIDVTDDTDLAAIGAPYLRCAQQKAVECRESAGMSSTPEGASPSGVSTLPAPFAMSWTGFFLECAGLPPDVDAFD